MLSVPKTIPISILSVHFVFTTVVGLAWSQEATIDESSCVNCAKFPEQFLEIDESERLDLNALPRERALDFLIGEWDIYYPDEDRAGYEVYSWFTQGKMIQAFQEWIFFSKPGEIPWRGMSYYQYVPDQQRWHFNWVPGDNHGALYTGRVSDDGKEIIFFENEISGDAKTLNLKPDMRYILKNITRDSFLVETTRTHDGGKTYTELRERLFYKKRS